METLLHFQSKVLAAPTKMVVGVTLTTTLGTRTRVKEAHGRRAKEGAGLAVATATRAKTETGAGDIGDAARAKLIRTRGSSTNRAQIAHSATKSRRKRSKWHAGAKARSACLPKMLTRKSRILVKVARNAHAVYSITGQ